MHLFLLAMRKLQSKEVQELDPGASEEAVFESRLPDYKSHMLPASPSSPGDFSPRVKFRVLELKQWRPHDFSFIFLYFWGSRLQVHK
jgi:hypothetical protein